jgi:hypothetical protein
MKEHELNPSKIIGECAKCRHCYDICRNGLCCDVCGGIGIRGAHWADTEGPVIRLGPWGNAGNYVVGETLLTLRRIKCKPFIYHAGTSRCC